MTERVVRFSDMSPEELAKLERINWVARDTSGNEITNWAEVVDNRYGTLRHVVIINEESGATYDKVDLDWRLAVFVVIYRQKEGRTEFLIPSERRVLLKDEKGEQGSVFIRNIPQGLIKSGEKETPEKAALREVKEETGIEPINLRKMKNQDIDAANSQTAMPFFLAEVDADELQSYQQSLDDSEEIRVSDADWFALEDIHSLEIECAKTNAGLMLATGYLGLWPKSNQSSIPFTL